jgi:hypothetical protein
MLPKYTCSRPPVTIRSHDLYIGNIRGAMDEIAPYHHTREINSLPSVVPASWVFFLAFL